MLVSFLIPTRKRPNNLITAVTSVFETARNPDDVEVVIYADSDDHETIEILKAHPLFTDGKYNINAYVGPRPPGAYAGIHTAYNAIFEKSVGEFVVSFNDDTILLTENWDDVLQKYSGELCIIKPKVKDLADLEHNPFPIVSRKISEFLGQFGWHASLDVIYQQHNKQSYYHVEDGILFEHTQEPAEHVKEGIITDPASWKRHMARVEDEIKRVTEYVKNEQSK